MKSRILVSMLVIALAAALSGRGDDVIFTAQKKQMRGLMLLAPWLCLRGDIEHDELIQLENMAPGDTIEGRFM